MGRMSDEFSPVNIRCYSLSPSHNRPRCIMQVLEQCLVAIVRRHICRTLGRACCCNGDLCLCDAARASAVQKF